MRADFLLGCLRAGGRRGAAGAVASDAMHRHAGLRLHFQYGISQLLRFDRAGVFWSGVRVAGKRLELARGRRVASACFVGASDWVSVAGWNDRVHHIVEEGGTRLASLAPGDGGGRFLRVSLVFGNSCAISGGLDGRAVLQAQWRRPTCPLWRSLPVSCVCGARLGNPLLWSGDFSSPERERVLEEHSAGGRTVFGGVLRDGTLSGEFSSFFLRRMDRLACLAADDDFRGLRIMRTGVFEASPMADDRGCGLRRIFLRLSLPGHSDIESDGSAGGKIVERAAARHESRYDDH